MSIETLEARAFELIYEWALDGDENESLRYEILGMGALIDELKAEKGNG